MPNHRIWKVFVVDDERTIASTLATILRMQGFDARFWVNPAEALSAAIVEPPDLLISDVMMPGMTGVELAIRLKKASPNCKILLFSGQAATADLLDKARTEGHDFTLLQKPIHPGDLLAHIGAISM
jgi:DNA-binding response OmpR family regulator